MSTHRRMIGSISVQIAVIANAVLSELVNFDLEAAGFLGELRRIKNRVGALVGRGISADSFSRILDNSVLDPGELSALRFQLGFGGEDSGGEFVKLMTGIKGSKEWLFQFRRADSAVAATTGAEVIAINRLAEFPQSLPPAILIELQVSAHAILGACLSVLGDMIAWVTLHAILIANSAPVNCETLVFAHARASARHQRCYGQSQPWPFRSFQ
jgi:hypothetical protein